MALSKIISGSITDGSITAPKVVSGMPVKFTRVQINPKTFTGSSTFPRDNTLPLISEGGQLLQYNYTPTLTSSTIIVWSHFHMAEISNVSNFFMSALFFNDICVNVRATTAMADGGAGEASHMILQAEFSNSDGSDLDIEIRCDDINGQTVNSQYLTTDNDQNYTVASSSFGGADSTNATMMYIMELK